MNRSNLIANLAHKHIQLTVADVDVSVKTMLDAMSNKLAEGGRVEIRGFGSFSVHSRPSKLGRNPRTGESVLIPETHVPHFKPGLELKERVNLSNVE